jgi:hypothetical protein
MLDRPVTGRIFLEQMIRDNLDIGRPDKVSLIFGRRIHNGRKRPTPSEFRTRIVTERHPGPSASSTRKPRSSSITRKGERCAPRPSSTIPVTSASAKG